MQLENRSYLVPMRGERELECYKQPSKQVKKKCKTQQPMKVDDVRDSLIHTKLFFNKACSTNFVIKNVANFRGTFYHQGGKKDGK